MCPDNRIGTVDLFVVSRHGQPNSNSETLVHAIQQRVIIMNNGLRKGGQPSLMKILLSSPVLRVSGKYTSRTLAAKNTPCLACLSPT